MSKATDCFDKINTLVASALSTFTKLPDVYKLSENPQLYLRNGFGIGFGPASNTNRHICNQVTIKRSFTISLIKQVIALEMSDDRRTFEKDIINSLYSVINAFENDRTLNGSAVKIEFMSDSGVQFLEGDTESYILLEGSFDVEYFEQIT
jgi:hypothetical protein